MNEYYFTFGQTHETLDGVKMKDYWVRVMADDYGMARAKFCKDFAEPTMGSPDNWSFQYGADQFEKHKSYFPLGEYCLI